MPGAADWAPTPDQQNRIRNLDAMVAQLRGTGIAVGVDPQLYPNGRFARVYDPEGNPVELWGPTGRHAPR
jgi:hypothetical protein